MDIVLLRLRRRHCVAEFDETSLAMLENRRVTLIAIFGEVSWILEGADRSTSPHRERWYGGPNVVELKPWFRGNRSGAAVSVVGCVLRRARLARCLSSCRIRASRQFGVLLLSSFSEQCQLQYFGAVPIGVQVDVPSWSLAVLTVDGVEAIASRVDRPGSWLGVGSARESAVAIWMPKRSLLLK